MKSLCDGDGDQNGGEHYSWRLAFRLRFYRHLAAQCLVEALGHLLRRRLNPGVREGEKTHNLPKKANRARETYSFKTSHDALSGKSEHYPPSIGRGSTSPPSARSVDNADTHRTPEARPREERGGLFYSEALAG